MGANLLFGKRWISCHAVGDGGGNRSPKFPEIGSSPSHDWLTSRILTDGMDMLVFDDSLTPPELGQLAEFLQSSRIRDRSGPRHCGKNTIVDNKGASS